MHFHLLKKKKKKQSKKNKQLRRILWLKASSTERYKMTWLGCLYDPGTGDYHTPLVCSTTVFSSTVIHHFLHRQLQFKHFLKCLPVQHQCSQQSVFNTVWVTYRYLQEVFALFVSLSLFNKTYFQDAELKSIVLSRVRMKNVKIILKSIHSLGIQLSQWVSYFFLCTLFGKWTSSASKC